MRWTLWLSPPWAGPGLGAREGGSLSHVGTKPGREVGMGRTGTEAGESLCVTF